MYLDSDDEFILIVITIAALTIIGFSVYSIFSYSEENSVEYWRKYTSGTIDSIDLSPTYDELTIIFRMDNNKGVHICNEQFEGKFPILNQTGIFYKKDTDDEIKYKWVATKKTKGYNKAVKKHGIIKIPSPNDIVLASQIPINWQSTLLITPAVNKTVLVKYQNKEVAAYLNDKDEWKLEVNRRKVLGGKTIKDIKEWKEIPR